MKEQDMNTTTEITSNAAAYLTGDLALSWDDSIGTGLSQLAEFSDDYDIPAIREDFLAQVAAVLPEGWTMVGDFIWAEVGAQELTEEEFEALRDRVAEVDFWAIAESHDKAAQ